MLEEDFFPEIITNLPEADILIEGARSHLFQGRYILHSQGRQAQCQNQQRLQGLITI